MRLARGEPTLRIDVPAFCCDMKKKLAEIECDEWYSCDSASSTLSYIISDYGGPHVYNAPLWSADKLVRLERRTVDDIYMHVVRHVGGEWIDFDRSYGRFSL